MRLTHIIERWTNGSWVEVGRTVSAGSAKISADALTAFGEWKHRWREV